MSIIVYLKRNIDQCWILIFLPDIIYRIKSNAFSKFIEGKYQ